MGLFNFHKHSSSSNSNPTATVTDTQKPEPQQFTTLSPLQVQRPSASLRDLEARAYARWVSEESSPSSPFSFGKSKDSKSKKRQSSTASAGRAGEGNGEDGSRRNSSFDAMRAARYSVSEEMGMANVIMRT